MTRRKFVLLNHPRLKALGCEFDGDNAICPGMFPDLRGKDLGCSAELIFSKCDYDWFKCRQCWDKQICDETSILKKALDTYGAEAQTLMAFEEMSELQKELCKHALGADNRENIAEEIADVLIMLEQMMMLYSFKEAVERYRDEKIKRLAERLKEEKT